MLSMYTLLWKTSCLHSPDAMSAVYFTILEEIEQGLTRVLEQPKVVVAPAAVRTWEVNRQNADKRGETTVRWPVRE
jgi:hypothetical protein